MTHSGRPGRDNRVGIARDHPPNRSRHVRAWYRACVQAFIAMAHEQLQVVDIRSIICPFCRSALSTLKPKGLSIARVMVLLVAAARPLGHARARGGVGGGAETVEDAGRHTGKVAASCWHALQPRQPRRRALVPAR
jgi:hypothetical protein